jgi:hypothetical protein
MPWDSGKFGWSRFDRDVVGVRRWRVRCGLPTMHREPRSPRNAAQRVTWGCYHQPTFSRLACFKFRGYPQRFRYFAGDVVLDHQDVVEWSVVGFRPDNVPVVRTNQPRGDPQPSA